jgi:hypothetical protein
MKGWMIMEHNGHMPEPTPRDLTEVAGSLDRLAAAERRDLSSDAIRRITLASAHELVSTQGRAGWPGRSTRLTIGLVAAVALIAVPIAVLGLRSPSGAGGRGLSVAEAELEQDLGALIYVASLFEDDDAWSGGLSSVRDAAAELDAALDDPFSGLADWAETDDIVTGDAT